MRNRNNLAAVLISAALAVAPPAVWGAQAGLQDPEAITAEVEAFLLGQAQVLPGAPTVTVVTPRITRQAACDHLDVFMSNPQLRSRVSVGVRCLAPEPWTLYVQANVSVLGDYYVANRSIDVGETLSLEDLATREGDLLRLANSVVVDPALIVGYIAQQRIAAGSTIRSNTLRDPDSIVRGQPVRTEARGVGFVATGEGVALESGAPGTLIQVRTSSGQVVSGTVVNNTTVRVMM